MKNHIKIIGSAKKVKLSIAAIALAVLAFSNPLYAQTGSNAGSFSRLGFGSKGMSMGNAMVSNIFTDVSGYYNPALSAFQKTGVVTLGYTFMSMDRHLNFLGFAKKFDLPGQTNGGAGISFSVINSGVTNIDGRDNDGSSIGDLSTSENQFYLATSFLLSERVSFGVGFKMYYSKLYAGITTTSIGFDLGAVFNPKDNLSFGVSLRDINAKYKWDTSDIYGSNGNTTEDKFPFLLSAGGTLKLQKGKGSVSAQYNFEKVPKYTDRITLITAETKNQSYFSIGGEYLITDQITVRAGLDRINPGSDDFAGNLKPSVGVGFIKDIGKATSLGLDYSFQLEPYSKDPIQNLGLVFKFK
ncbi:PorV/PorQ family protein [soil metagenome]